MFLQELGMSLIKPFLQSRFQIPTLRMNLRVMISNVLHIQSETPVRPATLDRKQRCHFCPRAKDRKAKLTCESCQRPIGALPQVMYHGPGTLDLARVSQTYFPVTRSLPFATRILSYPAPRYHSQPITPTATLQGRRPRLSVTTSVDLCFTAFGVGPLVLVRGSMNTEASCNILDNEMLPALWRFYGIDPCYFQDDNARCPVSRATVQWYADNNVRRLDWPAQSPDLNPIKHHWDELDRRVRARQARPKSIAQLMEWLQEEWRRIPVDVLQTLVESMPDRVAAVLAARAYSKMAMLRKDVGAVKLQRVLKYAQERECGAQLPGKAQGGLHNEHESSSTRARRDQSLFEIYRELLGIEFFDASNSPMTSGNYKRAESGHGAKCSGFLEASDKEPGPQLLQRFGNARIKCFVRHCRLTLTISKLVLRTPYKPLTQDMLTRVWNEFEYRLNVFNNTRVTAAIEAEIAYKQNFRSSKYPRSDERFFPERLRPILGKSKYSNRIRLARASHKQSRDTHKTPYDRVKRCEERTINIKASERVDGMGKATTTMDLRTRDRDLPATKINNALSSCTLLHRPVSDVLFGCQLSVELTPRPLPQSCSNNYRDVNTKEYSSSHHASQSDGLVGRSTVNTLCKAGWRRPGQSQDTYPVARARVRLRPRRTHPHHKQPAAASTQTQQRPASSECFPSPTSPPPPPTPPRPPRMRRAAGRGSAGRAGPLHCSVAYLAHISHPSESENISYHRLFMVNACLYQPRTLSTLSTIVELVSDQFNAGTRRLVCAASEFALPHINSTVD
ncbi:hypothetical protein PR048_024087 [Dryococelus australis]|uniref:Transposase n=1 Tax=Dryococelus australis TaxID=614101 RepID=A0ABQ9GVX0_9NEOP|nr:hypothetical protein PR048_024087 [Dryococelus australis]